MGGGEGIEGVAGEPCLLGGDHLALEGFGQDGDEARRTAGGAEDDRAAGGFGQEIKAGDQRERDRGERGGFGVLRGKALQVIEIGREGHRPDGFWGKAQEIRIG